MAFTTRRLVLRELCATDASFVCALMNEPSFMAQIGDRGVRTVDDAQRYIENGPWTRYAMLGFGLWLVELQATGEPIGICGLLKRDALPLPDIGFAFRPQFWSKGYAFEAACTVKRFAADALELSELWAVVRDSNTGSIHLLEKLGFKRLPETHALNHGQGVALYVAALSKGVANVPDAASQDGTTDNA